MNAEAYIHSLICAYLRNHYPDVIYFSDMSGVRLHQGLRRKMKQLKSGRGIPDLIILQPAGSYHGLMLELKTMEAPVTKKDGTLRANTRVKEQAAMIQHLRALGFAAYFVRGYLAAKDCIDTYMQQISAKAAQSEPSGRVAPLVWTLRNLPNQNRQISDETTQTA